jgi:RNA polymerase sigma-70 factor (ECF subfamily)
MTSYRDLTRSSVLQRLRDPDNPDAFREFETLYIGLIRYWMRGLFGLSGADLEDLTQDVLLAVSRGLPYFEHRGPGSFRSWLKTIVLSRGKDWLRSLRRRVPVEGDDPAASRLAQLEDPSSDLSRQWDDEHNRHLVRQLLQLAGEHFAPNTVQAFVRTVLDGTDPAEVARELGISVSSVHVYKFRVLNKLREIAHDFID